MNTHYKKKDSTKCLKATDNENWWSSVDTECSSLEGNVESFDNFGKQYEEMTLAHLNDISNIQELEKTLYDKLNNETLSNSDKKLVMGELLQLSTIKGNLYTTMNNLYDTYKNQVGTTTQAVSDQLVSIQLVENELTELSNKMQKLYDDNNSKIRLIEINRYYGEKYDDHSGFMKYLIIFTIFYILLYSLKKYYLIKDNVYSLLLFILVFIAIIVLGRYFYRMIFRNNMEYNEYQFPFANVLGTKFSPVSSTTSDDPWTNPNLRSCPSPLIFSETEHSITKPSETEHPMTKTLTVNPSAKGASTSTTQRQIVYGNNGSVTCDTYCGGTGGNPWNGELPADWNGAKCVNAYGSAEEAGCYNTFTNNSSSPGSCLCQQTGTGWN
jgi:hypothetical protein